MAARPPFLTSAGTHLRKRAECAGSKYRERGVVSRETRLLSAEARSADQCVHSEHCAHDQGNTDDIEHDPSTDHARQLDPPG